MATTFVALLRGINVGGHNKIPMAELRSLCFGLGWQGVQTYIQSGNIVLQSHDSAVSLERSFEAAIEQHCGLAISVVVRTAAEWRAAMQGNPFPAAAEHEPNLVMLAVSKQPPTPGAAEALRQRATSGEQIQQVGDALWIHYQQGVAGSKLSPALFDRLVGSPVTARNWRTVIKLDEMLHAQQ